MEKTLHLNLKKKWFDMILSGEKKEEYREIKPYWIRRLTTCQCPEESKGENKIVPDNIYFDVKEGHRFDEILKAYYSKYNQFDFIMFSNGYSKDARKMKIECLGIAVKEGNPEWGAVNCEQYFVLKLGKIISKPEMEITAGEAIHGE